MKLSLITVTYNRADALEATMNSVRDQEIESLEYIIVDGGSTDNTIKLLTESGDVVSRWISEPDNGIYDAMNKGVSMATGNVVGFLHADDRFSSSEVLKEVVKVFSTNEIDLLYGDLEYISTHLPGGVARYWKSCEFSVKMLARGWMPPHPTVYFKRDLIDKVGVFNTGYSISADYDWMLRCFSLRGLKVYYLAKVMVQMRLGGVSNNSLCSIIKKSREDYHAIKSNKVGGLFTLLLKNVTKIPQFFKTRHGNSFRSFLKRDNIPG